MPKRTDIKKILIIGSGPIVIGQACEFDYSGTQACKALRSEGYEVVLVNSNPATIMTDPETADRTYIEPITVESVTKVIEKERPDALLPNMGGQTGLNCAVALGKAGVLEKYGVEVIGCDVDSIETGEDRELFANAMRDIGLEVARSGIAHTVEECEKIADELGYPVVLRPAFTLGGAGGGMAYDHDDLVHIAEQGLALSPESEVLVEQSVEGWKEIEMEVMRDSAGNGVVICSIENLDPMGVHTGDSITVAPCQTLNDFELQRLRDYSLAILERVGVACGGSNVQFAVNPDDGRVIVIEMNPRVSRSSALASKATGFPIAKMAALLCRGLHPRRDRERHHARDAGMLRALHRLLRGQGSALRLREVQGHRRHAHHAHEGRGRGHVHRRHLRGGHAEGHALARAGARRAWRGRQRRLRRRFRGGVASTAWQRPRRTASST